VVAVAPVLCDSTRNSAENRAVGAARQAVAVVPEVAAVVEAVAQAAALPEAARRPVALRQDVPGQEPGQNGGGIPGHCPIRTYNAKSHPTLHGCEAFTQLTASRNIPRPHRSAIH